MPSGQKYGLEKLRREASTARETELYSAAASKTEPGNS
jgi:hypothetical protein